MRPGIKTTEFWLVMIAGILTVLQQQFFPEAPFPAESFVALGLWIAARTTEKIVTNGTNTKRAWQTTEFWLALGISIVQYVFPNFPPEMFYSAVTLIFGRPMVKSFQNLDFRKAFDNSKKG